MTNTIATKRFVLILVLVATAFAGYAFDSGMVRRMKIKHIRTTVVLSAGHVGIENLFSGLAADPRWNANVAAALTGSEPRPSCAPRSGYLGKFLSFIQRTVLADTTCTQQRCTGANQIVNAGAGVCAQPDCVGTYDTPATNIDAAPLCQGNQYSGSNGCQGSGCTWTSCNYQTCQGSCTCQTDSDCGTGYYCNPPNCVAGTCRPAGVACTADSSCCSPLKCVDSQCKSTACTNNTGCPDHQFCDPSSSYTCKPSNCDQKDPQEQFCKSNADCPNNETCPEGCCVVEDDPDPDPGSGSGCSDGSCVGDTDCDRQASYGCSDGCCVLGGSGGGWLCSGYDDACGSDADCCDGYFCNRYSWCDNDEWEDPLVIDLSGSGYLMTDVQGGVKFDFSGGKPVQTAWTAQRADVGWLVLDRNGDGRIDDGTELFSNVSPQPGANRGMNGFKALAVYDQPANGGDRDGWITPKDAVFSRLRIWVDANHNGKSEPNELITLLQAGIKAISVSYAPSSWVDVYGNQFRYKGKIAWQKPVNGQNTSAFYDVVLTNSKRYNGENHK